MKSQYRKRKSQMLITINAKIHYHSTKALDENEKKVFFYNIDETVLFKGGCNFAEGNIMA